MSNKHQYQSIRTNDTVKLKPKSVLNTEVLYDLNNDAKLLFLCKSIRLFSFGFLAVMLVLYLQAIDFQPSEVGALFTWTLLGDAVISLTLTSHADRYGRKFSLIIGGLLSFITSIIFLSQKNFIIILIASIFGVISPSGNEIGPFMVIEQSALSSVTLETNRTMLFAWYNLFGSFSSAIGALLCGFIMHYYQTNYDYSILAACRIVLTLYTVIQGILLYAFTRLSHNIEVPDQIHSKIKQVNPVTLFMGLHKSKWIVLQLSGLFMIDSFGGSFILQSVVSSWFHMTYNTSARTLGTLVFVCNIVAGVSALFAAKLADYIGLIMTMVVTHLPSNVLIILVPLMPTELTALIMLCLRYSISQMDVPTRQAYVLGVVEKDEQSAAGGVTNVVRSIGASLGPYFAGLLYNSPTYMNYPFFIAGGLKIVYDLLLLGSFKSVKPDHEITKVEIKSDIMLNSVTNISESQPINRLV